MKNKTAADILSDLHFLDFDHLFQQHHTYDSYPDFF